MTTLRILSYNIHKGFGIGGRSFVLEGIRQALATVEADIVFLQEVLGEHERHATRIEEWPEVSQFEYLADERWPHYAYAQNAIYDAGHHGNAILSRFPIVSFNNVDITTNPLERRGMLYANIQLPGTGELLHCGCVHMSLFERSRQRQLDAILAHLGECAPQSESLILAGDFNDWVRHADRKLQSIGLRDASRMASGKYSLTFPAWCPLFPLDRIYVRGFLPGEVTVLRGSVWRKLSDHAALLVEVSLAAGSPPAVNS